MQLADFIKKMLNHTISAIITEKNSDIFDKLFFKNTFTNLLQKKKQI